MRRLRAAAIALALAIAALVILDPNRAWMKRHVEAWILSHTGLDITYGTIHLHASGVDVDDIALRSPAELRPVAPDVVRAARLEARWSASSLLGDGPRFETIALSDVAVTVVVDEHGRTSLDAIPSPTAPPSQWAGRFLASTPIAKQIDVRRVDLSLVSIVSARANAVVKREKLQGLDATLTSERRDDDGWHVRADVGTNAKPLDVRWIEERDGSHEGRATLALGAVLHASRLEVTFDLGLREQSFVSGVELGNWHATASARFEPDEGRTQIEVERVTSPTGRLVLEGSIDLPDHGAPFVRRAHGRIDVAQLLVWIPSDRVTTQGGTLAFDVESAVLDPVPRLSAQGTLRIDAELTNLAIPIAHDTIDIGQTRGVLAARSVNGAFAVHGFVDATSVRSAKLDVRGVGIDLDGRRADDGALDGRVDVRFGELHHRIDGVLAIARDGRSRTYLDHLVPGWSARAIETNAVAALEIRSRGKRLVDRPTHVDLALHDVLVDPDPDPIASTGTVHASIDVGNARISFDAIKRPDAIDYVLRTTAADLTMLRPFLSPKWTAGTVAIRSNGRIERIASREPRIQQNLSLTVDRPAFDDLVSARSLALTLHSEGTTSRHDLDAKLRAPGLVVAGTSPTDDTLVLAASWDEARRSARVEARAEGRASTELALSAAFENGAVVYDVSGRISKLDGLEPLAARVRAFDGLDLSRLELAVAARGTLLGVVSGVAPDGSIDLAPRPWRTAAIEGSADVRVANVSWNRDNVALGVPAALWHGDLHADRTIVMRSDIPSVRLGLGRHQIDLAGISDSTTATVTGDLLNPAVELVQHAAIRNIEQDFVTAYPATAATLAMSLRREPEGLVRISNLHVQADAGTTLDLRGGLDVAARRSRKLSIAAEIVQDLQPLSFVPKRFSGRGTVRVAASVESPDLSFYRTHFDVTTSGVDVRLPGIEAQSVDAAIPITMDFDLDRKRARRETSTGYAMLRFSDQLPLLRHTGFFSIGRLSTAHFDVAPLVGNLSVEQNVVSVRQFEMGVRGGWVSGDGALDWNGARSSLEAHVRASGVRSTQGEPFDGNMAVVLVATDRSIDGRVEIRRMGKRHLLDVLDIADPLHVDPAMNNIRSALAFGYPSRLHVGFENGFANARVELGGLAGFVHFDEIRGVPTGLLVDRLVKAAFGERRGR